MSLQYPDLAELTQAEVESVQAELAERLAERFPAVELGHGVVHDVVLHLASVLVAAERRVVEKLRQSSSLAAVAADPTLADDDVVDGILANFRVERLAGAAARGLATIVLDGPVPTVIPAGAVFQSQAASFVAERAFAARLSDAGVSGPDDRALRPLGDGRYAFTIPLVAQDVGLVGMIRRGTPLTPSITVPRFSSAYAEVDFSGGAGRETNADLVARLRSGLASRAWAGRAAVDALARSRPEFSRILQTSIVGHGDAEMRRDRHPGLPIGLGGRVDVYARTAELPLAVSLTKQASLVSSTSDGSVWQFGIGRDESPGFYMVDWVGDEDTPRANAGLEVVQDTRQIDVTNLSWAPELPRVEDAGFSRYQAAVIRVRDPRPAAAGVTTRPLVVVVRGLPLLAELQDFLGGRDVRNPGGDVLVRAPVPCFLSLSFDIATRGGVSTVAAPPIAEAVAGHVNRLGFPGRLLASQLIEVVHRQLPDGAAVDSLDMFGRIWRPDGTVSYLRDPLQQRLEIPDDPTHGVSPRTVAFLLDPADVAVTVRPSGD